MTAPACHAAIAALLGRCDGASTRDGAGFNRYDAGFARELADLPAERWSTKQIRAAWWMLRKYRKQLGEQGIDYDAIPAPADVGARLDDTVIAGAAAGARIIDVEADAFIFRFPFDLSTIAAVKNVAGRRFVPGQSGGAASVWKAPAAVPALEAVDQLIQNHGFEPGPGVLETMARIRTERQALTEASRADAGDLEVAGLRGTLRPFQRAGVAYALRTRRCILGDEMGLGKTVQALAVAQAAGAFPALVICPATLKYNWRNEAKAWLPTGRFPMVAATDHPGTFGTDVTIINYDALALHRKGCRFGEKPKRGGPKPQKDPNPDCDRACRLLLRLHERGYRTIIFDEAHYLKSYAAKRTAAVKWLARRVDYRLALTGTPLLNRPQELISPLGILGVLEQMGGFWPFAQRYCGAVQTQFGWDMSGATNLAELNEVLRATCYVRRRKIDVLKELPPKTRARVEVDLSNRKEYDRVERDVIGWARQRAVAEGKFQASIAGLPEEERIRAIFDRWESAGERAARAERLVRIGALQRLAGVGKLEAVREWVESFLETGEKLVLFAHHVDTQVALYEAFPGAARVAALDDPKERAAQVRRFQESDVCRLIVCSLKAGGVGITLTAASNVALVEFGWTPADHDQAEDRCHRIGQHDNVTAWYLVARDTVEIEQLDLIESKRVVVDAATDGTPAAPRPADDPVDEFLARLARRADA